nr:MAG TPA: hypothetical protein [Caudoviricetes sp.]
MPTQGPRAYARRTCCPRRCARECDQILGDREEHAARPDQCSHADRQP